MEDSRIIDLYWARSELAIKETDSKYGKMCYGIANAMLRNRQDSEECVSDTYLGLWNAIPPSRPQVFSAYIAKITRNLAMKMITRQNARKRSDCTAVSIHELDECIPSLFSAEEKVEAAELAASIGHWLRSLRREDRNIFLRRYWFFDSIEMIAQRFGLTESNVKVRLFRLRSRLKQHLEKEGFDI